MNSIIQSANLLNTEECILERIKRSQYLLNLLSIVCPNCDESVPQKYVCCSQLLQNNIHDDRCMYKEN